MLPLKDYLALYAEPITIWQAGNHGVKSNGRFD